MDDAAGSGITADMYRNFSAIDEATVVNHHTSRFANSNEKVMHDSYIDDATRRSRRIRQVAGHMPLDWQCFRTVLANERNVMAWTRTFMKIIGVSWTILKIPNYQATSILDSPLDQVLGIICVLVGVSCLHLGIRRYVRWNDALDFPDSHVRGSNNLGWQIYFIMGLVVFMALWLTSRNVLDSHFLPHGHQGHAGSPAPSATP